MTTPTPTFRDKKHLNSQFPKSEEIIISDADWQELSVIFEKELTSTNKWLIQKTGHNMRRKKELQQREKALSLKTQATLKGLIKLSNNQIEAAYHNSDHLTKRAMDEAIIVGEVRVCSTQEECFKQSRLTPYMPPACYRQAAIVALYYQQNNAKKLSKYPYELEFFHNFLNVWIALGRKDFNISGNDTQASPLIKYFRVILRIVEKENPAFSTVAKRARCYRSALSKLDWPYDIFKVIKTNRKLEIVAIEWG